jgi:hypothetical protein
MKINPIITKWLALVALLTFNLQPSTTFAQGTTAFTYQGRLNVNGSPANGLYDVRFMVLDAPTNGNLIAGPLTNSATGVTNGLFAMTLDFGGGVFTGPGRWLQMGVRTNGGGVFTNLSPCQAITPVPYALYAQTSSGTNGSLTGNSITLGGGGTSWDIGVANNALTFSYGDPLVTLTNTPDGSLGVPNNITAGGNIAADGALQIGGTGWNINVGSGSGPASYSFNNALVFSLSGTPCLDLFYMSGDNYGAWFPGGLGSSEVDCGEMNVRNPSTWSTVTHIDSSGNINANGNIYANSGQIFCATATVSGWVNAEGFNTTSDRNLKEKFEPIDSRKVLEKVGNLPISSWNFKNDPATRHIGPMAQNFYAAFNVGTDDKHIATVDEDGVALAAIQGLNQKVNEQLKAKDAEIQTLKQQNNSLAERLNELEATVKQLMTQK